jgi:hypothetical protein
MDHEAGGISEVVYVESARALAQQRDAFESLRTRAGVLLSAAAISSSLFGGQAFTGRQRRYGRRACLAESVHRDMALHMERAYTMNQRLYASLASYFRAAAVLLSVEVLAWICDLATKA